MCKHILTHVGGQPWHFCLGKCVLGVSRLKAFNSTKDIDSFAIQSYLGKQGSTKCQKLKFFTKHHNFANGKGVRTNCISDLQSIFSAAGGNIVTCVCSK